jgi:hypothetical protein
LPGNCASLMNMLGLSICLQLLAGSVGLVVGSLAVDTATAPVPPAVSEGKRCPLPAASALASSLGSGDKPVILKASVTISREHGCSQSTESVSSITAYALALRGGSARLTVETFDSTSFGPSLGAFRAGRRDFSHESVRWRRAYTGTVQRKDGTLKLAFTKLETSVDLSGGIKFSDSTESAVTQTIDCAVGGVGVLPPLSSLGKPQPPAFCAEALLCLGLSELAPLPASAVDALGPIALRSLVEGRLTLLPEPGIDIEARDFYRHESASFRRAK